VSGILAASDKAVKRGNSADFKRVSTGGIETKTEGAITKAGVCVAKKAVID
jgi:hypothetical protein